MRGDTQGIEIGDTATIAGEAEEEIADMVLKSTFLGGVTGATLGSFLRAGRAVPVFGEVFCLLSDIKEHCQVYVEVEEESRRMSVWCISLMALFGRLADETSGEENSKQMLQNAATALKMVRNLVIKRNKNNKWLLGKAAAFWTSTEFRKQIKIASDWLEKAIQALSLNVSTQTKADVRKLLSKVDILPRMYESLDALHAKMDRIGGIIHVFAKKSVKEQIAFRKEASLNQCEIPASSVKKGAFINEGGQAKVYRATYAGHPAAVKEIPVTGSLQQVERTVINFKTEVDLINGFSHPNILQTYGVITTNAAFLTIVMAFAPDGTLRELLDIDQATPLSEETQRDYVTQLCHGFMYLHAKKVAHMDFKSLNVLRKHQTLLISDFGISRQHNTGATTAVAAGGSAGAGSIEGNIYGSAPWSAPETFRISSSKGDPFSCDMYALGVVAWEISTRKFPFKGANKNQIIGAVGFGKQRPGKPEDSSISEVQMVIATCWKEEPNERVKPMELLVILNGNEAVLVLEEGKEVEEDEEEDDDIRSSASSPNLAQLTAASVAEEAAEAAGETGVVVRVLGLECDY